jgi:hypothetical protein
MVTNSDTSCAQGTRPGMATVGGYEPSAAIRAAVQADPCVRSVRYTLAQPGFAADQRRQRPTTRPTEHDLTYQETGRPFRQHRGRQPQDIRRGLGRRGQAA